MEFVKGEIDGVSVVVKERHEDERGWLSELFRLDEMGKDLYPVMAYVSAAPPGAMRGPHVHGQQSDYFSFIMSSFKVFLWDQRKGSPTYMNKKTVVIDGKDTVCIVVPPGVVHAYKNTGEGNGLVVNFPNRLYGGWERKGPLDEIRHEGNPLYSVDE